MEQIKLRLIQISPAQNTYYGAPRPKGRSHAGVDTFEPARRSLADEAPQALLEGKVIKVGFEFREGAEGKKAKIVAALFPDIAKNPCISPNNLLPSFESCSLKH